MKFYTKLLALFILFAGLAYNRGVAKGFEKATFYSVLKTGKIADIDEQLELVKASYVSEKDAYEGVLLMRKAGLVKIPAERLRLFKKGRIALETAIANNKENGEYRFLRLVIEEKAPKIVKYNHDLEADKLEIKRTFKTLSPVVQSAIIDYSKGSKTLSPQDFNS
jgi:predicted regulator of amino acid metabolism with ACT domain